MQQYRNKETGEIREVSFFIDPKHGVIAKMIYLENGIRINEFKKFSKFILLYEGVNAEISE